MTTNIADYIWIHL